MPGVACAFFRRGVGVVLRTYARAVREVEDEVGPSDELEVVDAGVGT